MNTFTTQNKIERLIRFATDNGATVAAELSPLEIRVESKLAAYCHKPKCPYFGQSMSCPPNVSGPAGLRKLVLKSNSAIVLRIEIDTESLHGEGRPEVMRLLHEITAAVELEAKRLGFLNACGFAGGSCKKSFCGNHEQCRALTGVDGCRHPDQARPSISGFGVNVGELMKSAGWSSNLFPPKSGKNEAGLDLSWVAGLILLS
jgi:predicted metal-binding protein